jgi:DNA-binding NarL/FixJ family response regulator
MANVSSDTGRFGATLNRLICDLYEGCTLVPIIEYRKWALRELRREIPFSNAMWGAGSHETGRIHNLQGVGAAAVAIEAERDRLTLAGWLGEDCGGLSAGVAVLRGGNGASQVICRSDALAGLLSFITLGRGPKEPAFSETHRMSFELLTPHLIAGWRNCQLFSLRAHSSAAQSGVAAIVDAAGYVQSGDARLFSLLRAANSSAKGAYLPADLQDLAARGGDAVSCAMRWRATRIGDLTYLSGQPLGCLARLTAREQTIAAAILSGQSYAQSAATLGISVNTLRNTVARIYRKLGVSSKIELAQRQMASPGSRSDTHEHIRVEYPAPKRH